ncbi:MAG: resolvase, partial [Bacteroidales bacterium]|nr:resolvase [Bacteroidales bacterium]
SRYIHKRLRSAWLSIKRNLPYLFTFQDYPQLNIPNTNNAMEGSFTALKNSLRNHGGMSKGNRKRFIDGFFKA